jgi:hypothetical protein
LVIIKSSRTPPRELREQGIALSPFPEAQQIDRQQGLQRKCGALAAI